jgi:hypothetical protein
VIYVISLKINVYFQSEQKRSKALGSIGGVQKSAPKCVLGAVFANELFAHIRAPTCPLIFFS